MSKNLAHQLIHYKLIHKAYATLYVLHKIKHLPTPFCSLCNSNTVGTYMHMFYECQPIGKFWDKVLPCSYCGQKRYILKIWHEPTVRFRQLKCEECTTVKINKAKSKTLKAWAVLTEKFSFLISRYGSCTVCFIKQGRGIGILDLCWWC